MSAYESNDPAAQYNKQLLVLLLAPSWLSIILSAFFALAIAALLLAKGRYVGSMLHQQYLTWQSTPDNDSVSGSANTLKDSLAEGTATLQVFIFWCAIGASIYLLVSSLYQVAQAVKQAREQTHFYNYSRTGLLKWVYLSFVIRSASLAAWIVYLLATLTFILPYTLGAIHVADERLPALGAFLLLASALLIIMIAIHLHVILLRLLIGRPRVFHPESYIERLSNH